MNYLMRYPSAIKPLLLLIFLFQAVCGMAQDFPPAPNPPRLVNDFTGTLSAEEVAQLEKKLLAYSDSTSTQVSIVLLGSVGPYDISDYAFQLGEQWGIGGKGKDNGILILAAMEDRKIFIELISGLPLCLPICWVVVEVAVVVVPLVISPLEAAPLGASEEVPSVAAEQEEAGNFTYSL